MINVAYLLTPIEFGGAERVSLNFLKAFDRDKFNIVPILLIRPWEDDNFFINEIEKLELDYLVIPVELNPEDGRGYFIRILRCYRILFSILNKGSFSVMHTNGYFADIIGVPLAKLFRIPHLSTCHGFISDNSMKLYIKIDVTILKFSSKIIAVADDVKDKLITFGINENKILTIINAVLLPDLTKNEISQIRVATRKKFDLVNDEIVIGYIGRLSEEKGLKFLLNAGKKLLGLAVPLKILLIGDGSERLILEELALDLDIQKHVVFTGFQKDVSSLIPALDIFVLPSLTEGTPMALLEAMSYGIPAIASKVGGIPKVIISGENGILVTPENPTEIAESILKLYKNNEYWMKLSDGAKTCIKEKYNLTAWVHNIESIYFDVAS